MMHKSFGEQIVSTCSGFRYDADRISRDRKRLDCLGYKEKGDLTSDEDNKIGVMGNHVEATQFSITGTTSKHRYRHLANSLSNIIQNTDETSTRITKSYIPANKIWLNITIFFPGSGCVDTAIWMH